MHLVGEMLEDDGVGPLDAALWGMQEILYHSGGKAHRRDQVRGYFTNAGFVDVADDDFVPDVLVRAKGGARSSKQWLVEINPDVMPKLRINEVQARALRTGERRQLLWRLFVASFCAMQVMMLATPSYVRAAPPNGG